MFIKYLAIVIFLGACESSNSKNIQAEKKPDPSPENGRFQLVQLGSMRRDQYLIDTATGKLWQPTCHVQSKSNSPGDCNYSAWRVQDIEGVTSSKEEILEMTKFLEQQSTK